MSTQVDGRLDEMNTTAPSGWARNGPIVTLLLLAPVISEVLYGATRTSTILVLLPEIMTWGCGALIIRYWVRRWRRGWPSMLLLGLALAVAEECIMQQTSFAPLIGAGLQPYGRALGVNWVYLLWALGYESVWVVLVPVQFTELLFPGQARRLWLRTRGMLIAVAVFVFGGVVAWYSWTQMARVQMFHMPPYSPPALYVLGALAVILLLILAARRLPAPRHLSDSEPGHAPNPHPPNPWLVAALLCLFGSPWTAFVLIAYGTFPQIPLGWVLTAALAWAALPLLLMIRWTRKSMWGDPQRYAMVFGAVLACTLGGFVLFKVSGALPIDWIGKSILNAAFMAWLVLLGRKLPSSDLIGNAAETMGTE